MKLEYNSFKDSLDLDAVIDALGIRVHYNYGNELNASCPLPTHGGLDNNPSFYINREKMVYNCFACAYGGTILNLVKTLHNDSTESATAWLLQFVTGMATPESRVERILQEIHFGSNADEAETVLPIYNPRVIQHAIDCVDNTDYFVGRGLTPETIKEWKLGYDPARTRFNPKLKEEYVGPAVIIPHFFKGVLVGYQERWLGEYPIWIPKYTNSKHFPKAETLFGFDKWNGGTVPIIVESAFTALYLWSLGYYSLATFGAKISREQIALLRRFRTLYLSFDNDVPGDQATRYCVTNLKRTNDVRILPLTPGHKSDLNDVPAEEVGGYISNWIPPVTFDIRGRG